jgi:phage N-6-adenine-methyltransferase
MAINSKNDNYWQNLGTRVTMTKMPAQKPGMSVQTYATPTDFMAAVELRFGEVEFDLAASSENAKAFRFFHEGHDSLKQDWTKLRGNLWLNPPFRDISPWAEKCSVSHLHELRQILFLTPASVGANWFRDHVHKKALVLALAPRLSFDGKNPYPKDCILSIYGVTPGFDVWTWK